MNSIVTQRLEPDPAGVSAAVRHWRAGGLVAFPTETVYGLGADARSDVAVAKIYEAKGRPAFNPLIVHVSDLAAAERLVVFDNQARRLAGAFWPGALTLVLPVRADAGISKLVTAGLDTLAIRVPDHPIAGQLLAAFDGPIAAPSANPSGRVSPTTPAHVLAGLDGRIDAVVDGGACPVGLESTIVGGAPLAVLRAGGIPAEAIAACLGMSLQSADATTEVTAPGQLASHYAPQGRVRLNVTEPFPGEIYLGFGPGAADLNLSESGDLLEAAASLFACLHQLDEMGAAAIAVAPIPESGLGVAINDRLARAAAPRE